MSINTVLVPEMMSLFSDDKKKQKRLIYFQYFIGTQLSSYHNEHGNKEKGGKPKQEAVRGNQ